MRSNRLRVTWKKDVPRTSALFGRNLIPEIELLPENATRREALVPGSLWTLEQDATTLQFDSRTEPPPLPYLTASWRYNAHLTAPRGTMAVYMGTTRVEELGRGGSPVRVLRHTFLIGGSKYMTINLNLFIPV